MTTVFFNRENRKKEKEEDEREKVRYLYIRVQNFFSRISGIRQTYWPEIRRPNIKLNQYPVQPYQNIFRPVHR